MDSGNSSSNYEDARCVGMLLVENNEIVQLPKMRSERRIFDDESAMDHFEYGHHDNIDQFGEDAYDRILIMRGLDQPIFPTEPAPHGVDREDMEDLPTRHGIDGEDIEDLLDEESDFKDDLLEINDHKEPSSASSSLPVEEVQDTVHFLSPSKKVALVRQNTFQRTVQQKLADLKRDILRRDAMVRKAQQKHRLETKLIEFEYHNVVSQKIKEAEAAEEEMSLGSGGRKQLLVQVQHQVESIPPNDGAAANESSHTQCMGGGGGGGAGDVSHHHHQQTGRHGVKSGGSSSIGPSTSTHTSSIGRILPPGTDLKLHSKIDSQRELLQYSLERPRNPAHDEVEHPSLNESHYRHVQSRNHNHPKHQQHEHSYSKSTGSSHAHESPHSLIDLFSHHAADEHQRNHLDHHHPHNKDNASTMPERAHSSAEAHDHLSSTHFHYQHHNDYQHHPQHSQHPHPHHYLHDHHVEKGIMQAPPSQLSSSFSSMHRNNDLHSSNSSSSHTFSEDTNNNSKLCGHTVPHHHQQQKHQEHHRGHQYQQQRQHSAQHPMTGSDGRSHSSTSSHQQHQATGSRVLMNIPPSPTKSTSAGLASTTGGCVAIGSRAEAEVEDTAAGAVGGAGMHTPPRGSSSGRRQYDKNSTHSPPPPIATGSGAGGTGGTAAAGGRGRRYPAACSTGAASGLHANGLKTLPSPLKDPLLPVDDPPISISTGIVTGSVSCADDDEEDGGEGGHEVGRGGGGGANDSLDSLLLHGASAPTAAVPASVGKTTHSTTTTSSSSSNINSRQRGGGTSHYSAPSHPYMMMHDDDLSDMGDGESFSVNSTSSRRMRPQLVVVRSKDINRQRVYQKVQKTISLMYPSDANHQDDDYEEEGKTQLGSFYPLNSMNSGLSTSWEESNNADSIDAETALFLQLFSPPKASAKDNSRLRNSRRLSVVVSAEALEEEQEKSSKFGWGKSFSVEKKESVPAFY